MTTLRDETRGLLASAAEVYRGSDQEEQVTALTQRFDGPLRVAIAGKIKAGKSTLLNALVGTHLAPTDEGECTQIVTWYENGPTYDATAHLIGGQTRRVNFEARGDDFEVSLGDLSADEVERLVVELPSAALRASTYIDTPGVGSLSRDVSQRTSDFLTSGDEDTPVDAVLYLMKHLHSRDIDLLRAFHDTEVSQPNPVNALGILSRADEVGAGRPDAMDSARRVAARLAAEDGVRRLVQTVVPIVGLLAETAMTLTEPEYRALVEISSMPEDEVNAMLISADRFVNGSSESRVSAEKRERLLARFAIYGIRVTTSLIRSGDVTTATELSQRLQRLSGLDDLKRLLDTTFLERRDILKSRSALLALVKLLGTTSPEGHDSLSRDLERVIASAHAFKELRVMSAIRGGWVPAKPDVIAEMERLLGAEGQSVPARLGVKSETDPEQLRIAAAEMLGRWQRRAENPLTKPELAAAARVVVRSCEALLGSTSTG